jgi:hypothetical protein
MRARRGCAADKQRQAEFLALHLARDMRHLLERRRDQARQPIASASRAAPYRGSSGGHHDAEVHDVVVVALEHDRDDVLADVVHVALDGGHHDLAFALAACPVRAFSASMIRHEVRDGLFHHARGLDDLRQEHLAGAEQVADHVHAVHQRPSITWIGARSDSRLPRRPRRYGRDAVHERVHDPLLHRAAAPRESSRPAFARP